MSKDTPGIKGNCAIDLSNHSLEANETFLKYSVQARVSSSHGHVDELVTLAPKIFVPNKAING